MANAPQYRCQSCEDRGWIVRTDETGVDRAAPCDCARRRGLDIGLGAARIPERYRHCTIHNFSSLNDTLARAKKVAEEFVRDWPQNEAGLLISGPCGSGKTHLAVGILQELIRGRHADALYVDCALLVRQLQDSFSADGASRPEILRPVESAQVLLLDDLGSSKASEWVRDTFAGIINVRYNASRLTLITTRFPDAAAAPSELTLEQQVGAAVRSRLYEMCTTHRIEAEDFRRSVRNASH